MQQQGLVGRELSKSYGGVHALKNANIEIAPGEVMALVGENGAGKSTLVKILCGVVRATTGDIEIGGASVDVSSPGRAQRQGIAVVQQEMGIVDCLSVAENIVLGSHVSQRLLTRRYMRRLAQPHLEAVGLGYLDPDSSVDALSVAERQLLEVARVASREPRVVILDEPTAALAESEIRRVHDAVRRLRESGCGVLYITHRLGEVFTLADRVTVIRDGISLPPSEVAAMTTPSLIQAMLGRPLDDLFPERRSVPQKDRVLEFNDLICGELRHPLSGHVARGEIVGFVGQVGSGASAALRGLGGASPMQSGTVICNGARADVRTPRQAIRSGVAYCSGDRKLDGIFANRSVVENLTAPSLQNASARGWIRRGDERRRAETLAELVGAPVSRLSMNVNTLSGGNQQKVVLGKWLGAAPAVLLVEEPTRGVDVGARAEIYRKLREMADRGLAIICASSDSQEIYGLSDRVVTFFRGAKIGEHDPSRITHSSLVRDITDPVGPHPTAETDVVNGY